MKQTYIKPEIEIIEVEHEGVMALSGFTPGGGAFRQSNRSRESNAFYSSDLEDMINDILTFED